jgi:hypothetical protein
VLPSGQTDPARAGQGRQHRPFRHVHFYGTFMLWMADRSHIEWLITVGISGQQSHRSHRSVVEYELGRSRPRQPEFRHSCHKFDGSGGYGPSRLLFNSISGQIRCAGWASASQHSRTARMERAMGGQPARSPSGGALRPCCAAGRDDPGHFAGIRHHRQMARIPWQELSRRPGHDRPAEPA